MHDCRSDSVLKDMNEIDGYQIKTKMLNHEPCAQFMRYTVCSYVISPTARGENM